MINKHENKRLDEDLLLGLGFDVQEVDKQHKIYTLSNDTTVLNIYSTEDLFFESELRFNGRFVTRSVTRHFENLKPFLASFNL